MNEHAIIDWASWISLDKGLVSFREDWKSKNKPALRWGADLMPIRTIRPATPESYARQSGYMINDNTVTFVQVIKKLDQFNPKKDTLFVAGPFNNWSPDGNQEWQLLPRKIGNAPCLALDVPLSRLEVKDSMPFKFVTGEGQWMEVPADAPNASPIEAGYHNLELNPRRSGRHRFYFVPPLPLNLSEGRDLFLKDKDTLSSITVQAGVFLKKLESDLRLGVFEEDGKVIFRIFAPRARAVKLYVYKDSEAPSHRPHLLQFVDGCVWEIALAENLEGWYYHYTISGESSGGFSHFDADFPLLDPYARAVCGPRGPCIVVLDKAFGDFRDEFHPPRWHECIIVESHVRDLTHWAPVAMTEQERLGFSGLKKWVESRDFYLQQLGVNVVELQPIQEYDTINPSEYAWGYMPVNYFSPASQYALDSTQASQISEFRALVKSFHDKSLAVVLDVVYNHVGEPNFLQFIDKEYYFLLDEDGHYENLSGCGNTLDCDAPMVRRLIRDSLEHLIVAYGVDGFRFDLGELIGKDTLAWLEKELKKIKPSIIFIAEPWSFRGHIAEDLKETGISSWNDGFRECMAKYLTGKTSAEEALYFVKGSHPDWSRFPAQTVNYAESHDDRCWIDKITENPEHNGSWPTMNDRHRTHLMISMLMVSLGMPMIHSGIDMLKSKGGFMNSYLRGDLNAIPYERAAQYSSTRDYLSGWINFRRSDLGKAFLCRNDFPGKFYFREYTEGSAFVIIFNADASEGAGFLAYGINPSYESVELQLDDHCLADCRQIADTERFDVDGLSHPHFYCRDQMLRIPPLSSGLWLG